LRDEDNEDALTLAEIRQLCWEVAKGEIAPEDARRLIEAFSAFVDSGQEVPPELLGYLSKAFSKHLNKGETLGRALCLTRKRGRPRADADMRTMMAVDVQRYRADGLTHEAALANVSIEYGLCESVIGEAFTVHREIAEAKLRIERLLDRG
jgi:hypothetical protein